MVVYFMGTIKPAIRSANGIVTFKSPFENVAIAFVGTVLWVSTQQPLYLISSRGAVTQNPFSIASNSISFLCTPGSSTTMV